MTLALSLLCSAIYTITIAAGPFPGRWAVKSASVALLACYARRYPLVAAGLFFGSIGDALLDLSSKYFTFGLVAFLCGHIAYTVGFLRMQGRLHRPAVAALVLYAAGFLYWLWPSLGAMRIPVTLYVGAITVMAATSIRGGLIVAAGAVLFLFSDSVLAANRFRSPVPGRDWVVWLTYYGGQLLIATGTLGTVRLRPSGQSASAQGAG